MADLQDRLQFALVDRYRIERELGSGGMALVYLAEDLKHRRKVALKVLRAELAATMGPERFIREIEVAARLQHPHILPLHDSGEAQGFLYYVMPFVAGHNLRGRLTRHGELPVHDAVKVLIEVADALAYAHANGVVHRDIKPENILLSGRHALVTDFGVAKAVSEATGRQALTTAGVALGTPTYMAPEQATADPQCDHRVDIYALGCLGYELLAGRPPFSGLSSQEVLAAHVTREPTPISTHRPALPEGLEAVIMKCLAKRPADRWQTADELLVQLEPLATPSGGTTPTATRPIAAVAPAAAGARWTRWLGLGGLAAALIAGALLILNRKPEEIRLGRRLQLTLNPGLEIDPSLSPDGKFVAYVTGPLTRTRLFVKQVEGGAPVAITPEDASSARMPRWSPDGQRLVFSSRRGIEVIPALGGVPRLLVPLPPGGWLDAAWSPDGESIGYALGDSVYTRPVDGSSSRALGQIAEAHSCSWSPDGRWIACVSGNRQFVRNEYFGNIAASSIWVIPAAGGEPVRITDHQSMNTSPAWVARPAALLYVSNKEGGRDIYQVMLTHSGRPNGEAVRLTTGLGAASVSVAADGRRLVYAAYSRTANVWTMELPRSGTLSIGRAEPVTTGSQEIEAFDVSSDGRWLIFDSDRTGTQQLYRMPLAGGEVEQLTNSAEPSLAPSLSPDGREIAYHTFRGDNRQVFVMPAEGGAPRQVTFDQAQNRIALWTRDGRTLVFQRDAFMPSAATAMVSRDAGGRWGVIRTLFRGGEISVPSPDGRLVLTLSAKGDMVTVPVGGGEPRRIVSSPRVTPLPGYVWDWSPDGSFVYYIGELADRRAGIWRIAVSGGTPRQVLTFDDPSRYLVRLWLKVRGNRIYFTKGDQQSDVWLTEISGRR